jgi:pimeloyl-ACP methyl ester carboxylesterase
VAGPVHRRAVIWPALVAITLTLVCAGASRAITAASKSDCQNVTQPKIKHGTTPILFVHGIFSDPGLWDGITKVTGTNQDPLSYIQTALGTGQVKGYTFNWSRFSGFKIGSKISWVTDRPPADLGVLLAQAIICVATHAGHKVILIAHSMGGLLAEYAGHVTQAANDIAAVFTLGTPYQGSWLASSAVGQGPGLGLNLLAQAIAISCAIHLPQFPRPSPSPSPSPSPKSPGLIEDYVTLCNLLHERNDPGIAAMRLKSPGGGGWKGLAPLPAGLPWYPLAASVQGVWQPAPPVPGYRAS